MCITSMQIYIQTFKVIFIRMTDESPEIQSLTDRRTTWTDKRTDRQTNGEETKSRLASQLGTEKNILRYII